MDLGKRLDLASTLNAKGIMLDVANCCSLDLSTGGLVVRAED
jgi:hypothetical protein